MRSIIGLLKDILLKMLELISLINKKLELELLWQNPSPSSAFKAQTINMDLIEGDLIAITFKGHATVEVAYFTGLFIVDGTKQRYSQYYFYSSAGQTQTMWRDVTVKTTGITFTTGYLKNANAVPESSTSFYVPVKIRRICRGGGY